MSVLKTISYIELDEVQDTLDKKHHVNYLYDYLGAEHHFYKWCDEMGYGQKDKAGRERGSSQIWFKEYEKHPKGDKTCPETLNFLGEVMQEPQAFLTVDSYLTESKKPWVAAIAKEILETYGHLFPDGAVVIKTED